MKIAIIPARGGSKRIPKKNIRLFAGRPMIVWAISTARRSGLFDRILVSTDDEEIAAIARSAGAETPFVRPANLADDSTPTVPVIAHGVRWACEQGWPIEYACCIYPCVPFLRQEDLQAAFDMLCKVDANFAYAVTDYVHPIQRAMRRLPNGCMEFRTPEHELARTQDLERAYHDTGQFYWGRTSAWLEMKRMHSDRASGLVIPNWRVVDIDCEEDWTRAELIFKALGRTAMGNI